MLKFITKVWVAGEVNDFRINRKKRKQEQKQLKKAERQQRVAELGIIEEKIKGNEVLKSEYRKVGNRFSITALILILSIPIAVFFPPIVLVGILDAPIGLYYAIKLTRLKNKILNN